MGFSRLNVWLRTEECKPLTVQRPGLDYVNVKNCMGDVIAKADMPIGESHVELEVPPGCYIVQGHVCEPIVRCNQDLCVNLIVPRVRRCVWQGVNAFVREALAAQVRPDDLRILTRTILVAGGISPEEMGTSIEGSISALKDVKEAIEVRKEYQETLKMLRVARA